MRNRSIRVASAILSAALLGSVMVSGVAASPRSAAFDLFRAVIATARYHSTVVAGNAGYGAFPAGVPLHDCIATLDPINQPGAMGFHWLNPANLNTDLDPTKPQVLVYAPDRNGGLHLVALEYVVFQQDWYAAKGANAADPELFGEMFMKTGDYKDPNSTNRYQIPPFFALHVWIWKYNPAGLFAPFNPNVSCTPGHGPVGAAALAAAARVAAGASRFDCAVAGRRSAAAGRSA